MKHARIACAAALSITLAGCAGGGMRQPTAAGPGIGAGQPAAVAMVRPTAGNTAQGLVRFIEQGGGVRVVGEVRGLRPNSEHGFHVHEKGDCSSPDATSAGGHFNPGGQPHGFYGRGPHHAGDMPNIRANANGVAQFDFLVEDLGVSGGPASVVGRGLVVHRDPDDYRSQPAGNSGPRVACGVITRA